MSTIPVRLWIANAAACLSGRYGSVTRQARRCRCSRQTVYNNARQVREAVESQYSRGPSRARLLHENEELRCENGRLWDWLYQMIEFPDSKRREFAVRAAAMGLSLNQIVDLLAVVVGAQAAPGRSSVHRWVAAAAAAAGKVLQGLDQRCKGVVATACLDEVFFHGRPVFVGVEPRSMTLILARKGERLDRAAWLENLAGWDALRYVVCDAGTVLQSALAWLARRRQAAGASLEVSLDVFHTIKEARRLAKISWNRVRKDWKAGLKADARLARSQRQKEPAREPADLARAAWAQVALSMERYDAEQAGWRTAGAALELFRPDGRLNDRAWAEAQVVQALPALGGGTWTTLRHVLQSPKAFTFLDRLHAKLGRLPIRPELCEALTRLYWLRRSVPDDQGRRVKAILLQEVVCWKLAPDWENGYRDVARTLRATVRASSAAECVNSVLRMHQSRHRNLGQGLLDLKRLYWNTRTFRGGRRRGRCPYQWLGLDLPTYDFMELIRTASPEFAAQENPRPSPG